MIVHSDTRRMVLIGGGTGLAPFISYALHLKAIGSHREIVVSTWCQLCGWFQLYFSRFENESLDRGKDKWNFVSCQYKQTSGMVQ
jgi:ferredoxin--NADP+ reductase